MATPFADRVTDFFAALLFLGLFAATGMATGMTIRLLDAAVSALLQGMGYPPVSWLA